MRFQAESLIPRQCAAVQEHPPGGGGGFNRGEFRLRNFFFQCLAKCPMHVLGPTFLSPSSKGAAGGLWGDTGEITHAFFSMFGKMNPRAKFATTDFFWNEKDQSKLEMTQNMPDSASQRVQITRIPSSRKMPSSTNCLPEGRQQGIQTARCTQSRCATQPR